MTYTNKNNRWYDERNNSWATQEAAEKYSPTLSNCSNCSGCSGCSDCSNCSNCFGCSYCSDCSNCSYCSDCSNCYKLCNIRNQTPKAETQNDLSGKIIEIDGKKYKLTKVL